MQKKLFIAGGKFSDIPTIKSAKMLGYYVITSGNNPNDLGHIFSDEIALCDYSNVSSMLDLVEKLQVDALMSSCDDVSALTCSYISNSLNLGNFDDFSTAKIIHHKDLWRRFLRENNINSPKALSFDNINEAKFEIPKAFLDSKIIIKPVDFATGKGVNAVYANDEILFNLELAMQNSKSKRIVVEEFIDGSNHGFSVILQNQKVIFYFYDDEQHDFNPFAVSGTTTSQKFTNEIISNLINQIEQIAKILHLKNGIFHTQVILHKLKNNKVVPYIIEACRRMGGDLYAEFVSQTCGIDYPSLCIQAHNQSKITHILKNRNDKILDKNILQPNISIYNGGIIHHRDKKYFSRQCIMSKKEGIIKNIDLSLLKSSKADSMKASFIKDALVWAKSGDYIDDVTKYKAGIVFFESDNMYDLQNMIDLLPNCIRF